jgi:2-succinyl-6-hydroxy-2,4-cyclohexadiene-1-carboxylate synthase
MPRLTVNGLALNIETSGQGASLVLLHGFTGAAAHWSTHSAAFAPHAHVIAVDLPGHGASESPPDPARYRMERCVDDLRALFDALGLERVKLLGYSMGGRVALHFAAAHPERVERLILESASPGLADPAERAARTSSDEELARFIEENGVEAFVKRWEALPLFASQVRLPEAARAALRAQRLRCDPRGLANSLRGLGTGVQSPLWERLPTLPTPTLLIAGELDAKFAEIARAMRARLPAARLEIVAEAGHTVHLEQPEAFARIVIDFLTADRDGRRR